MASPECEPNACWCVSVTGAQRCLFCERSKQHAARHTILLWKLNEAQPLVCIPRMLHRSDGRVESGE